MMHLSGDMDGAQGPTPEEEAGFQRLQGMIVAQDLSSFADRGEIMGCIQFLGRQHRVMHAMDETANPRQCLTDGEFRAWLSNNSKSVPYDQLSVYDACVEPLMRLLIIGHQTFDGIHYQDVRHHLFHIPNSYKIMCESLGWDHQDKLEEIGQFRRANGGLQGVNEAFGVWPDALVEVDREIGLQLAIKEVTEQGGATYTQRDPYWIRKGIKTDL